MKCITVASIVLLASSLVGCCSMGASLDPCDPCARELAGGGCFLRGLLHHKCMKCKPMMNCAPAMPMSGCCDDGCGSFAAAPAAASCGCGGGAPHSVSAPPNYQMPAPQPIPAAAPAAVPGAPPAPPAEFPPPAAAYYPGARAPQQRVASATPQQVSYEEFQRLPGVVISAPPTAQAAPAATWAPTR